MGLFTKSTPTVTTTPPAADPSKPLSAADSAFLAQQQVKSGGLFGKSASTLGAPAAPAAGAPAAPVAPATSSNTPTMVAPPRASLVQPAPPSERQLYLQT